MFGGQDSGDRKDAKKQGAKQSLGTAEGAERRGRQLIQIRSKAQKEKFKMLRHENHDEDTGVGQFEDLQMAGDLSGIGREGKKHLTACRAFQERLIAEGKSLADPWSYPEKVMPEAVSLEVLEPCVHLVTEGTTPEEVYRGTLLIRKLLSVERNPPYARVVASGVVPFFVKFLDMHDFPQLQFEAAWALTNVAADTHGSTKIVMDAGAVAPLIRLVHSPSENCRDQASWALGNLAGDGAVCRDECLRHGLIPALCECLSDPGQALNVVRNSTWALMNVCRCKPYLALPVVEPLIPLMIMLMQAEDRQVVIDAAWCISALTDGSIEHVHALVSAGVLIPSTKLLQSDDTAILTPVTRIVGNIAAGNESQTQALLNAGALSFFPKLLQNPQRAIRKEICWTVSNISAGSVPQIDTLVQSGVYPLVIDCVVAPELDVKKEALWAIANTCFCGEPRHAIYLLELGVVPKLSEALKLFDERIVIIALEALQCLLEIGESLWTSGETPSNLVAEQMSACGAVADLEALQSHSSTAVYDLAARILQLFFMGDDVMGAGGDGFGNQVMWQDNFDANAQNDDGYNF